MVYSQILKTFGSRESGSDTALEESAAFGSHWLGAEERGDIIALLAAKKSNL